MSQAGVWMQLTSGSLLGAFGRRARYWGERMLDEGLVHILATDAHNVTQRPPNLSQGHAAALKRVGAIEAERLVVPRPQAVLMNEDPSNLPTPGSEACSSGMGYTDATQAAHNVAEKGGALSDRTVAGVSLAGRLRAVLGLG